MRYNVRLLRAIRGMTQFELADAAQVQRQYLWNIECRKKNIEPRLHTLCRVADALGVSISQLLKPIELVSDEHQTRASLE